METVEQELKNLIWEMRKSTTELKNHLDTLSAEDLIDLNVIRDELFDVTYFLEKELKDKSKDVR